MSTSQLEQILEPPPPVSGATYRNLVSGIQDEYLSDRQAFPWIIGFSGGKDSTLVAHLVIAALLDIPSSRHTRPIHVVANDTLVESPLVVAHLHESLAEIRDAAKILGLPITVATTAPNAENTFWVLLIGKGYPSPNSQMRWCTDPTENSADQHLHCAAQIREQVRQKAALLARLKELANRRIQLQGVDDDGTYRKLNEELKTVQASLNELNRKRGDLERQLTALDAEIKHAREDYERENAKYLNAEPAQSVARKAQRVMALIDGLLPQLFEQKTQTLSAKVTERFKSLAHKKQVKRIEIDSSGTAQMFTDNEQPLRFDRAAGENQIFATALFAGLADVLNNMFKARKGLNFSALEPSACLTLIDGAATRVNAFSGN